MNNKETIRVLMYSHDTYGLGHIRRTLAIAKEIRSLPANILIITGSPLVGRFVIPERTDFVRIPGMIKVTNEEYQPLSMKLSSIHVLSIREEIILTTAKSFRPDFFIVDKAPLGLRKEVIKTLLWIKEHNRRCITILGLRDIMDSASETKREWREKNIYEAMENLYDEIWVYGTKEFYDPIKEYEIPPKIAHKVYFTGYIPRYVPSNKEKSRLLRFIKRKSSRRSEALKPLVLLTAGGGGDGYFMFDNFLKAFEKNTEEAASMKVLFVTGPFIGDSQYLDIQKRASLFRWITFRFHRFMEALISVSDVIITMGGYNTLCEIFTLRKPSIILPRSVPREEQLLRAQVLCNHGYCDFIAPEELTPEKLKERLFAILNGERLTPEAIKTFPLTAFEVIKSRIKDHLKSR